MTEVWAFSDLNLKDLSNNKPVYENLTDGTSVVVITKKYYEELTRRIFNIQGAVKHKKKDKPIWFDSTINDMDYRYCFVQNNTMYISKDKRSWDKADEIFCRSKEPGRSTIFRADNKNLTQDIENYLNEI